MAAIARVKVTYATEFALFLRMRLLLLAAFVATPLAAQTTPPLLPYDTVDPMIGTGGEGHTFPGATAPFGMVQLSPDTDTSCVIRTCYAHAAGYRYEDPTIQGFSHTHFSGAGHSDLGDFLIMPVSGETVPLEPGDPRKPGSGYRSRFDHHSEVAHPGYYAVSLIDQKVRAELTAGTRIGVHRYSFVEGADAHLVLDLRTSLYNYPGKIMWSEVRLHPDGTITGSRETRGWALARKLYFAMHFSHPLIGHAFVDTEKDVAYRGFQGPGRGTDAVAERTPAGRSSRGWISAGSTSRSRSVSRCQASTKRARSPIWTRSPAISTRH